MSSAGVVLLGLSVWTTMKTEISQQGIRWRFEQQLATALAANEALAEEVHALARSNEVSRQQLLALTRTLQEAPVLDLRRAEEIRAPIQAAPSANLERLEQLDQTLRKARSEMLER